MATKKRVVEVKEVTEIYCDLCGEMVSDGLHDGAGGINFWGVWVKLFRLPDTFVINVKKDTYEGEMIFELRDAHSIPSYSEGERWVVCKNCSVKIKEFITGKWHSDLSIREHIQRAIEAFKFTEEEFIVMIRKNWKYVKEQLDANSS